MLPTGPVLDAALLLRSEANKSFVFSEAQSFDRRLRGVGKISAFSKANDVLGP
jgi:hypothetical protein